MPKVNLTDTLIKNEPLIEKGKAKEIYDEDVTNLLIRISKTRKVFYYRYRINGNDRKDKLGVYDLMSLKEARREALRYRLLVEDGIDPRSPDEDETYLFEEIVEQYQEHHVSNLAESTQDVYQYVVDDLGQFHGKELSEISITDISQYLIKRKKKSVDGALLAKSFLSGMFSWSIQMGYTTNNPVKNSLKIEKPKPKQRYYDEDEIRKIYKALPYAPQPLGDLIQFLFLTGKRKGESLDLKYEMIDFKTRWVTLPNEIIKKRTGVDKFYLTDSALNLINERKSRWNSEYVFNNESNNKSKDQKVNKIHNQVYQFRKQCKIDDFTPHDIRRTITVLLSKMGVPANVKDIILNNASSSEYASIQQTYDAYDYRKEQKEALEKLESKLEEIISKESPESVTSE